MQKVVGFQIKLLGKSETRKDIAQFEKDMIAAYNRIQKKVGGGSGSGGKKRNPLIPDPKTADDATKAIREMNKELRRAVAAGEEVDKGLVQNLAEYKKRQQEVNAEIREMTKELQEQDFAPGSYRQLNAELVKIRREYREMSEAERKVFGKDLLKRADELDKDLRKIDTDLKQSFRSIGQYERAFSKVGSIFNVLAGVGGITELIDLNAQLSDSLADVTKTTGLSGDALEDLRDSLEARDTRTSIFDQLGIARIGGNLGIATDELYDFTEALDTVNVALGDDLGGDVEQIALDLGTLAGVLEGERTVADGITRVGSAINFLGTQGRNTAPFLVDFSKRTAGVAESAGLATPDLLGFGAAFQEIGQKQEVSASSFQRLLGLIAKDTPKIAKLIGLTTEEFTNLVNNNPNEAILTLLDSLNSGDPTFTEFQGRLKAIGVNAVQDVSALSALAQNTELVRTRQAAASAEFERATSLSEEFATKNENLAATIEKIKNEAIEFVTGSGLLGFLTAAAKAVLGFLRFLNDTFTALEENRGLLVAIVGVLVAFNKQLQLSALLQSKYLVAIKESAIFTKAAAVATKLYETAMGLMTRKVKLATLAQRAFNLVMKANPIGLVITAIGLLVALFVKLYKENESVRESFDGLFDTFRAIWDVLSELLKPAIDAIIELWNELVGVIGDLGVEWEDVVGVVEFGIDLLVGYWKFLAKFIGAAVGGIVGFFKQIATNAVIQFDKTKNTIAIFIKRVQQAIEFLKSGFDLKVFSEGQLADEIEALKEFNRELDKQQENAFKKGGEAFLDTLNKIERRREEIAKKQGETLQEAVGPVTGGGGGDFTDPGSGSGSGPAPELDQDFDIPEPEEVLDTFAPDPEELKKRYEELNALLQTEFAKRKTALKQQFADGEIDEKLYQDLLFDLERERLYRQLSLNEEYGMDVLAIKSGIADQEIDLARQKAAEELAIEKQKQEQLKEIQQQAFNVAQELVRIGLAADKRNLEEFYAEQKSKLDEQLEERLANNRQGEEGEAKIREEFAAKKEQLERNEAEARKDLARKELIIQASLAAIKTIANLGLPAATPSLFALALITAARLADLEAQKFKFGGALDSAVGRFVAGVALANGGALSVVNNSGYIPREGSIIGGSHDSGKDVQAVHQGRHIRVEGGEYKLMDGNTPLIINKRSAKRFRPILNRLRGREHPMKRMVASQINSYGGFGVPFAVGGSLGSSAITPPDLSIGSGQESAAAFEMAAAAIEMAGATADLAEAINDRIDRLKVVNDRSELLDAVNEEAEFRQTRNLSS